MDFVTPVGRRAAANRLAYNVAATALSAVAFLFTWAVGHRGVFLLDHSIIFDGGWRILQGQAPYRDFLMPFGPVVFWIQATFFWLVGVNWQATVMPAALMNAIAAASVMRTTRLLTGSRTAAILGGAATAVCFAAPFGTLWLEQTAMFFSLLAIQATTEALEAPPRWRCFFSAAAGGMIVLAVLSKQNFGLLAMPLAVLVLAAGGQLTARERLRLLLAFLIAMCGAAALFWASIWESMGNFMEYVVAPSRELGRLRLKRASLRHVLAFSAYPLWRQLDLAGLAYGFACLALAFCRPRHPVLRRAGVAGALAILLAYYRSLTQAITLNEEANGYSLAGLGAALGLGALLSVLNVIEIRAPEHPGAEPKALSSRMLTICAVAIAVLWTIAFSRTQIRAAWQREVQQFGRGTRFESTVQLPGFEGLRWGEPTRIRKTIVRKSDFEAVARYLRSRKEPFFVMGDATILHALAGVRPAQPMLYFQPNQSFFWQQAEDLDRRVYRALVDNDVRLVVREKETFLPAVQQCFERLPRLNSWFRGSFRLVSEMGIFEIWERAE